MDEVFTIGHSNHEDSRVLELLHKYGINLVLDVRSSPYSKRFPQFNRETFSRYLSLNNISYLYMGEFFGARQPDNDFYTDEGWLHYAAFTKSLIFKSGVRRLDEVLAEGKIPALMCAEKDPFDCHRAIMVSRELAQQGYLIKHILASGELMTQAGLDNRLLDKYFPDRDAGSIFDLIDGERSEESYLEEAYLLRNKAIAWRREQSEEEE